MTTTWTFVTIGPHPPERTTLVVNDQPYRSGEPVPLTQAQHDRLVRDGTIFKEDIVQTPGG